MEPTSADDAAEVGRVDFSALTAKLTRAEVAAYRSSAQATGSAPSMNVNAARVIQAVVAIVGIVIFGLIFTAFGFFFISIVGQSGANLMGPPALFFMGIGALVAAVFVIAAIRTIRALFGSGPWQRRARLDRFARRNGLAYLASAGAPTEPGMIFGSGSQREAYDQFTFGPAWLGDRASLPDGSPRRVQVANYSYVTGSGDEKRTHYWGYLLIQLDRRMPNMLLDAIGNDGSFFGKRVSSLPVTYDRKQRLSLEGDFDRHFTLYAPTEYERDALYVFTPDLMALLIDQVADPKAPGGPAGPSAAYDVEIVDDRMFIYSTKPFDLLQGAVWQRLFTIVSTVGHKTLRQTTRYADERVGDRSANVVAPEGRRLKRRVPVVAFTIFIAVFAYLYGRDFVESIISFFN